MGGADGRGCGRTPRTPSSDVYGYTPTKQFHVVAQINFYSPTPTRGRMVEKKATAFGKSEVLHFDENEEEFDAYLLPSLNLPCTHLWTRPLSGLSS